MNEAAEIYKEIYKEIFEDLTSEEIDEWGIVDEHD